jgi:hypothetical protein
MARRTSKKCPTGRTVPLALTVPSALSTAWQLVGNLVEPLGSNRTWGVNLLAVPPAFLIPEPPVPPAPLPVPNVAQNLAIISEPSVGGHVNAILPAVHVEIRDNEGNPNTTFNNIIVAGMLENEPGATLGGTLTKTPVQGVAVFDNLSLNLPGVYTVVFVATGLAGVVGVQFSVSSATV